MIKNYEPFLQMANEDVRTIVIAHKFDHVAGCIPMPKAENNVTRKNESFWNLTKEHSVDSFTKQEIESIIEKWNYRKGADYSIWEQSGKHKSQ